MQSRDTGQLVTHEHFRYDPAANRMDLGASSVSKVADNRLKNLNNQEFSYDSWGNLTTKRSGRWLVDVQEFKYDSENRLVNSQVWHSGRLVSEGWYHYDSLGRRTKRKTQARDSSTPAEKTFLWQGLRLLQEQAPDGQRLYLYKPNTYAPLARIDDVEGQDQQTYYFHTDQIGTPLEMSHADGRIVWQATFKAWGELQSLDVGEVEQNLRFQGQYFDVESGLHYNTFRYSDPQVGRFTTQDPIGLLGGNNLYLHVANPAAMIDVNGLCFQRLGRAMGHRSKDGMSNHHLVPEELMNKKEYAAMFARLTSIGFKRDGASNGIFLPSDSSLAKTLSLPGHWTDHKDYTAVMRSDLDNLNQMFILGQLSDTQLALGIGVIQRSARFGLENGRFAVNPVSGGLK